MAILSCNASPETMADLKEILGKNICSLRLSEDPTFENLEPDKVEQFLMENLLRVCVLVIDASTLKDGSGKGKLEEYQRCFETALRRVGKSADNKSFNQSLSQSLPSTPSQDPV